MEIKGRLIINESLFLTDTSEEQRTTCKESLNTLLLPFLNTLLALSKGLKIEEVNKEVIFDFYEQQERLELYFSGYVDFIPRWFLIKPPTLEEIKVCIKTIVFLQKRLDKILEDELTEETLKLAHKCESAILDKRGYVIDEFLDYATLIFKNLAEIGVEYVIEKEENHTEILQTIKECKQIVERLVKSSNIHDEVALKERLSFLRIYENNFNHYLSKLEYNVTTTRLIEMNHFKQKDNRESLSSVEYTSLLELLVEMENSILGVKENAINC